MAIGSGKLRGQMQAALAAPKQAITVAIVALFVGLLALVVALAGKGA